MTFTLNDVVFGVLGIFALASTVFVPVREGERLPLVSIVAFLFANYLVNFFFDFGSLETLHGRIPMYLLGDIVLCTACVAFYLLRPFKWLLPLIFLSLGVISTHILVTLFELQDLKSAFFYLALNNFVYGIELVVLTLAAWRMILIRLTR